MMNAQWNVVGLDQNGSRVAVYLASPDLKNPVEAKRRAGKEAQRRWAKKGLTVQLTEIRCVG